MKLLMIGHLLGDFYFQTNKLAEKKRISLRYTFLHSLLYSIIMFVVILLITGMYKKYISFILIIGLSHFVVDGIKNIVYKKASIEKHKLLLFVIDQIVHIIILYVINYWYIIRFDDFWNIGISSNLFERLDLFKIICACLACGKPSAIIVSLVFEKIPQTIREAQKSNQENNGEDKEEEKIKIGSWIGILEREIILILGLLGEYGAIGFVVAAKSVARHSQLDNTDFAEKYLIGTLLSTFIALVCIVICVSA